MQSTLLTNEELFITYQQETNEQNKASLKEKFFKNNKRLPYYVANKFLNTGVPIDDLASIASIGMVKAFNSFDPLKVKFVTYAHKCMENEILMFLEVHNKQIKTTSTEEVIYYGKDGSEFTILDILEDETTPKRTQKYENKNLVKSLLEVAKVALDDQEYRSILNMVKVEPKSQEELGKEFGLTKWQAYRLNRLAIQKLKHYAIQNGIVLI